MPTGMGVTNPKLSKGGRKLKKTKHCTIPKTLNINEKKRASSRDYIHCLKVVKRNATMKSMQTNAPNKFGGA